MFEYKVISLKDILFGKYFDPEIMEREINELGLDGWELVAITNYDAHQVAQFDYSQMVMFFKRQKQKVSFAEIKNQL